MQERAIPFDPVFPPSTIPCGFMVLDDSKARLLAGTRAADASGRVLVLHHGTLHRFDRFDRTEDYGFHFGSLGQAKRRLQTMTKSEREREGAGAPRIVSVCLAARNPVIIPHDPKHWGVEYVGGILERFLTRPERREIQAIACEARAGDPRRYPGAKATIRAALLRAGHDSIVYRNKFENVGRRSSVEWSWVALDADMIVPLGEGVDADHAFLPEGFASGEETDPDAYVRLHGGLRDRNWDLARIGDIRLFHAAMTIAVESVCGPIEWQHSPYERCRSNALHAVGDIDIKIEIESEGGRIGFEVLPGEVRRREGSKEPLQSIVESIGDLSPFARLLDRLAAATEVRHHRYSHDLPGQAHLPVGRLFAKWHPGEPLRIAVARLHQDLLPLVEELRELAESGHAPVPSM